MLYYRRVHAVILNEIMKYLLHFVYIRTKTKIKADILTIFKKIQKYEF
jgi:hypothetical protein